MDKQNQFYTPMEQVLINSALYLQALETKKKTVDLLALDTMLLDLEAEVGLKDGLPLEFEGVAL